LEADLIDSSLSSSNLIKAIEKALKMSSNLSDLWVSGDLKQKGRIQNLVFPSGIGYNKLNGGVQTKRVNAIFSSIPLLTKDLSKIKSGESINYNKFSARVTSTGFKPVTF
jgi:site-specific DNA recombinase